MATSARRSSTMAAGAIGSDMPGTDAMSCAGLMGLAIAASRPSLAERQTARARGAALAADPAFQAALRAVGEDARRANRQSDIYYLWSLERVCVALGLRSLDGFDWYAHGARILVDRQEDDGGWPTIAGEGSQRPASRFSFCARRTSRSKSIGCSGFRAPRTETALVPASPDRSQDAAGSIELDAAAQIPPAAGEPTGEAGANDVKVIVTGASEQSFPRISVQFEVKRPDGSFLLDAARDDFRVTEEGRDVDVVDFQAPRTTEAIPTTVVLVVDRSLSMEEEDRIGGLKRAVTSFLEKLPEGSRVAVIAFGSDVDTLCSFTTDRGQIKTAVDALEPAGATRFYDAVAVGPRDARPRDGPPRRPCTDGRRRHVQPVGHPRFGDRGRPKGSGCRSTRWGWEPRKRSRATTCAVWPSRPAASTTRPVTPTSSARFTNRSRSGSVRAIRWSIRATASFPTARCGRCASSIAAARTAGETAVFIPGMVVPAGGWSPLFLALAGALTVLLVLPGLLARWKASA